MTQTEKKRRAAVVAVSAYTQMETKPDKAPHDTWQKRGISRIIRDRQMVQSRVKTPGVNPFL
ncbi:hypothetical protein ACFQ5N_02705 [Lutibacter holmesii]|uniref:Uncharacterized protein n=1 Tax=Lutibacter holmesii TaxID=1137985 RepID=A0ABW3WKB9_9FLAO